MDKIDVRNISPAEFVSENTPPTIIVIGREDTVTPIEGSQLFKKNMDKHKNECKLILYDGVGHLFTPSSEPDNGWPNPDKKNQTYCTKGNGCLFKKTQLHSIAMKYFTSILFIQTVLIIRYLIYFF